MRSHELSGQRFGRLTAMKKIPVIRYKKGVRTTDAKWLCTCDCGLTTMVSASDLVSGRTKSCGCFHDEVAKARATKHGHSHKERLYTIWYAMKQRCYYNKSVERKNYSMKGIKVCDEWRDNYPAFREWSYANGYFEQEKGVSRSKVLSIDRIDPDKDYCPENCQWITFGDNSRKRFTDMLIRGEGSQEWGSAAEHSGGSRPDNSATRVSTQRGEEICRTTRKG